MKDFKLNGVVKNDHNYDHVSANIMEHIHD